MNTSHAVNETAYTIIPDVNQNAAGAVTYWRLFGDVDLDKLGAAWKAAGLDLAKLPPPPSIEVAFGRAVRERQDGRRLVRPLESRHAWAIVDEHVDDGKLSYTTLAHIRFEHSMPVFMRVDVTPDTYAHIVATVNESFNRQKRIVATTDISAWLVDTAKRLVAVALRDTGGIYFVPKSGVPEWETVTRTLEKATGHRVFRIPALPNADAVAAIIDAVEQETVALVDEVFEALTAEDEKDKIGARAIKSRTSKLTAGLAKLAQYEQLLSLQLPELRDKIESAQAALATAALA